MGAAGLGAFQEEGSAGEYGEQAGPYAEGHLPEEALLLLDHSQGAADHDEARVRSSDALYDCGNATPVQGCQVILSIVCVLV